MSDATPGPWKIADVEVVGGMGFHKIETVDQTIHEGEHPCPVALAYCIDTHVFEHLGDSEANARLIAAAPDLLAACKAFDLALCAGSRDELIAAAVLARGAISKAEQA